MNKNQFFLLFLMLSFLLFFYCGKKAAITGKVVDITGEGLDSVIVAIEKSAFNTITDKQGNYSIEYAPGTFKLTFFKYGYTSHDVELNLSTEMKYPAETVELCPFPPKRGIYLLEGNKVISLRENYITKRQIQLPGVNYNIFFYIDDLHKIEQNTKIKPGTIKFIDNYPEKMRVFRINLFSGGHVGELQNYYENWLGLPLRYDYNGLLNDNFDKKIGKEKIVIRSTQLEPGIYAWAQVEYQHPVGKSKAFVFKVDSLE